MQAFFGPPGRLIKFLSLLFGIAMFAATVATLLFHQLWLAIACAVIAAWALNIYMDHFRRELTASLKRNRREPTTRYAAFPKNNPDDTTTSPNGEDQPDNKPDPKT